MPDHKEEYRTCVGALLSVVSLLLLVIYASYKFQVLTNLHDYTVQEALLKNHFEVEQHISSANGFAIASAITKYDGSSEVFDRSDMGMIQFYLKKWGKVDDSGKEEFRFVRLPTKYCAPDYFNDVVAAMQHPHLPD